MDPNETAARSREIARRVFKEADEEYGSLFSDPQKKKENKIEESSIENIIQEKPVISDKIFKEAEEIEETPVVPGEEKQEQNQTLRENPEQLRQKMEEKRKEYIEADYKRKKAYKRLGNFFGRMFGDKKEANFEKDEEIAWFRAHYDEALLKYKSAILEDAKSKGASDQELVDIAKVFKFEANVNISDVHDQVKIENNEGRFSGFIKKNSMELVQRYKKLPLEQKIAIGAAFGIAGLGAGYLGAAAVGVVGSAVAVRRAFIGVVTGTSIALSAEAVAKRKTEKNIQEETKDLRNKMEGLNEEEKFNLVNQLIEKDIKDIDNKINRIKNRNLRHLTYGVMAGVAAMLLPKITRFASEKSGLGEWLKEHIFKKDIPSSAGNAEKPVSEGSAGMKEPAVSMEETEQTAGGTEEIIIEAKKGDSVWKIIEEQLKERYSNQFVEMNPTQKTYIVDALKDKVVADPKAFGLENADNLKIGQKMDLTLLFKDESEVERIFVKAEGLSEEAMKDIDKNSELWARIAESEKLNAEVSETPKINAEIGEENFGDDFSSVGDNSEKQRIISELADKNQEIERWQSALASRWEPGVHEDHLNGLLKGRNDLVKELVNVDSELAGASKIAGVLSKQFSDNSVEKWRIIKGMTMTEALNSNNLSDASRENLARASKIYPFKKSDGNILKWISRISRLEFVRLSNNKLI